MINTIRHSLYREFLKGKMIIRVMRDNENSYCKRINDNTPSTLIRKGN